MKKPIDDELSQYFKSLREIQATSQELTNWKRSVQNVALQGVAKKVYWLPIIGALCLGAIIGIFVHKQISSDLSTDQLLKQLNSADATFEHTHNNLD